MLSDELLWSSHTVAALRRHRRICLVFSILFFAVGIVTVTVDRSVLTVGLAALCLFLTGLFIRGFVRHLDPLKSPLIRLIRERPDRIVWIFAMNRPVMVLRSVHVRCSPRRSFVLFGTDTAAMMRELSTWCPEASLGWSKQVEEAYIAAPEQLRRRASGSELVITRRRSMRRRTVTWLVAAAVTATAVGLCAADPTPVALVDTARSLASRIVSF